MSGFPGGTKLCVDNVTDGETIYQRCLLIKGRCSFADRTTHVLVKLANRAGLELFPVQTWPVSHGFFKALILLSPGDNTIKLETRSDSAFLETLELNLVHAPLAGAPKLHLAIMIARDSRQQVDCPPSKAGGHSDLFAVIAKFRMTAYMWQALTAEDMRLKGLGRRSFQLEEDWISDTVSRTFINAGGPNIPQGYATRPTAKVHLVRSDKSVAEIRHEDVAQQHPGARDAQGLYRFFHEALKAYGGPFQESAHPTVAGLILDSHYAMERNLIVGHAALGAQNRNGVSLGIFGSHLAYSWPRYLEEVTECLLDTSAPGKTVGNDCNECGTVWEACSIGQGAFLHEVGHAFGAPHTYGIMARGYAQHWPRVFVVHTAYCSHTRENGFLMNGQEKNEARWALQDALTFKALPNFALPTDIPLDPSVLSSRPRALVEAGERGEPEIVLRCDAGIALVLLNDNEDRVTYRSFPPQEISYTVEELKRRFNQPPLKATVVGMNGRVLEMEDLWRIVSESSGIPIPGMSWSVSKHAITTDRFERGEVPADKLWAWACLLNRGNGDTLLPATALDLRIGSCVDGMVVYYADGSSSPCGPRWNPDGSPHVYGGHLSQKLYLSTNAEISKIQFTKIHDTFFGLRVYLANGKSGGELNYQNGSETLTLEPGPNEKIVGFYGKSQWESGFAQPHQFGILTIPRNAELPAWAYDMPQLLNTDGGTRSQGQRQGQRPPVFAPGNSHHRDVVSSAKKKLSDKLKKYLH